ncbi:TonB-dependent receptor domain-containing protein [Flavobacterium sp.]|uniref:TonB-dependent receptor domain-containing protein n=1 Tax=Flavobacterium sp. TaxID=239 RepID=UPI0037526C39
MKKLNIKLTLLIIISSICQFSFAQKAEIKGKVSDEKGNLEFVDVNLKKTSDTTKIVGFTSTDSNGNFSIENIDFGTYTIQFRLIGYKIFSQKITVSVTPFNLNMIQLQSDAVLLNSVVVTSQKKLIQKTQEGFIFNATATISQIGGTATDLLKSIPTVSVDADGGITLRGKAPLILINGKNSAITNVDQIAASSIDSIEIVNNPTAKYDANAESGVINIKLKKNNQNGTNGSVVLGAGFGAKGRINSSFLVNHKTKKWNFGLGYDNRFAGRTRKINASRTNYFIVDEHLLTQTRDDKRLEQLQNLNLNIEFSPNDKNNFSFEATANTEGQDNNETLISLLTTNTNAFYSNNKRHSLEIERSKVAEFALNYERKYADDRKSLTSSITSSFNKAKENTDIDQYNYDSNYTQIGTVYLQRTHNYENENVSNAKLDYAFPISEKSIVETGYKGTFRFFTSEFESADKINNDYIVNNIASNTFKFNEQINAVYGMLNSFIGTKENQRWNYNLGIRVEQVNNNGKTVTQNTDFNTNYIKFFPSASLKYNVKSDEFLKIGYSKRINRPQLGQLNPFLDITDALNPHSGNPYLKPEIVNALELGYDKEWTKCSLSVNSFYRNATNTIKQYSELQGNGVILLSPRNFGTTITYGLETIINLKFLKFYDTNISFTAFQQNINGSNVAEDVVSKAFNWYGKWINNFVPWQNGKVQLIGNYNSKLATPQGNRVAIYNIDMGFQQKLGKGNARLGLVATDVFNTLQSGYENNTANFTNNRTSKSDTRAVLLTFAYTFKSTFKEKLMDNQFTPEY